MQHQMSPESLRELSDEVAAHADTIRARREAARVIAARRYWQRTKRNAAIPFAETLRQEADLSR